MSLWTRIRDAIEGEATTVETTLSELEQKLMPAFSALVAQIEKTIGQQGVTILEQGLGDLVSSGGNPGEAIASLVPQVISEVEADAKQDASNAAHGAAALILASISAPAPTPAQ